MNIDRMVLVFAGLVILASVILTLVFSEWWLVLTGFVGLNLLQAGFSRFCPAAKIFKFFGAHSGNAFE